MNTNELADKIESFGKSGAVVEQAVLLEAARQLRQLADAPKAVTQLLTQLDGEGTRLQQAREETESLRSELTRWQNAFAAFKGTPEELAKQAVEDAATMESVKKILDCGPVATLEEAAHGIVRAYEDCVERNKQKVESLEKQVDSLKAENNALRERYESAFIKLEELNANENKQLKDKVESLNNQVDLLRTVLIYANPPARSSSMMRESDWIKLRDKVLSGTEGAE